MPEHWLIWAIVLLAVLFDYINGFHDTANAIATSVSTRAITPRHAIMMAAVLNFAGAMVSTGVAKTIGGDLVLNPAQISLEVIVAALIGSIIWNIATWYYRIPSSSSHSLIGGVIGAVCISVGPAALDMGGIEKIILSLILSPVIALATGYFVMIAILWIVRKYSPIALNRQFRKMQLVSASLMAFSHGSNDAQKAMGIIALALLGKAGLRHVHGLGHVCRRVAYHFHDGDEDLQDGIHQRLRCRPEFVLGYFLRDVPALAGQYDARRIWLYHGRRFGRTGSRRPLGRSPQHGYCLVRYHTDQRRIVGSYLFDYRRLVRAM